MNKSLVYFALPLAFALQGCYINRWTNQYDSLFNSVDFSSAIIEESQDANQEDKKQNLELLKRLQEEKNVAYQINAGDKIDIRVYGHPDLCVTTKVSPDGSIGMVFVGQLVISGLTISEAKDAIEKGLAPYVKNPIVGITVLEVSSTTVTISGATAKPGLYNITDSTRLADIFAEAGGSATRLFNGFVVDVADLENSIIVRDGVILPVDFASAIKSADKLNNVRLRKGDYIFIAQRMESNVTICGEVRSPHRRPYEPGMGLIETLTTAGWMLESHWSNVIIIRNGLANPKMYKINVDKILCGKARNIELKPNDIVYVPKDNLAEYNVFVRKLMPTAQLLNLLSSKVANTITL